MGDLLGLFNIGPDASTSDVMVAIAAVSNAQHESAGHEWLDSELKQFPVVLGFALYHAGLKVDHYRLRDQRLVRIASPATITGIPEQYLAPYEVPLLRV